MVDVGGEHMKILIADDNKQITSILDEYARKEKYETVIVHDGQAAVQAFEAHHPDLLLLDVMMPVIDGFSVCREIRKISQVPIIMITARGEDYERIMGLETGADDYIVKPFSPGEVIARIKAVMRRIHSDNREQNKFVLGNLAVDLDAYQVQINEQIIPLTKKEVEILYTLSTNANKVFSRGFSNHNG